MTSTWDLSPCPERNTTDSKLRGTLQVSLVVSTSLQTAGVSYGLGTHYYDQTIEDKDTIGIFSISAGFALILAASWSKTSFAISLLRIAGARARVCTWFVIVSVNLVFAANGIVQWVQCWPVRKQWDAEMVEGTCLPPDVVQNFITFVAGRLYWHWLRDPRAGG